jgi:hypothetical protein
LGNPPWERIKLQEKEFFAAKDVDIANAQNKAAREKLIKLLSQTNPKLLQQFEDAKHDAEAQSKFIRESGRFPLTAVGDINTYAVFAETVREIINNYGRCGVIVPTGIATDMPTKDFFADLIQKQSLASLYDFENREYLFPDIYYRVKFCLLILSKKPIENTCFSFFLTQPQQIEDNKRKFQLTSEDILFLNPNTLTCPIFRTKPDAEITKKIYRTIPILENEATGENAWGISFMRMFDMSNDSHLFKDKKGDNLLPLYEAKMFYHYDHRYGSYTQEMRDRGQSSFKMIPNPTIEQKKDYNYFVEPRYWINHKELENKLNNRWNKKWLLVFRGITSATNEYSTIFSILPYAGVGDPGQLLFTNHKNNHLIACLLANCNSLVFDFIGRQKIGGTHLTFSIMKQLPIIPPENYSQEDIEYISSRVLELVYTANELKPFAEDMGYDREPFIWDENRRAKLRAELDAKYAKLYGLTRDELRYILDPANIYGAEFPSETFRVLKNKEINKYGEYRTQRLVLAAWDMLGF